MQPSRRRRIRLSIISHGNTIIIRHTRRKVPAPVNWREMVARKIYEICNQPVFYLGDGSARTIPSVPHPKIAIEQMIVPDSMTITVENIPPADTHNAGRQYSCIDKAVELMDTTQWPSNVSVKVIRRRDHVFVGTDLRAGSGNTLAPARLRNVKGVDHHHISTYTTKRGGLGLMTHCSTASQCGCRKMLPAVWMLAWEV